MPEIDDAWENTKYKIFLIGFILVGALALLLGVQSFDAGQQKIAEVAASKEQMNLQLQELLREKNQDLRHARRIIAGQRRVINSQGLSLWATSVVLEVNQARLADLEDRHGDDLRLIDQQSGMIDTLERACRAQ